MWTLHVEHFAVYDVDGCTMRTLHVGQAIEGHSEGVGLLIWMLVSATIACVAVGCTHYISPHAIGSGIPEMKVMVSDHLGPNLAQFDLI
jgi:H+/Cl- antiporter ClcA